MRVSINLGNSLMLITISIISVLENCPLASGTLSERLNVVAHLSDKKDNFTNQLEDKDFNAKYNLEAISKLCPKSSCFSSYNPNHRKAVQALACSDQSTMDEFIYFSTHLDDFVHPRVWYNCIVRSQHLRKFENFRLPSAIELFPSSFVPDVILRHHELDRAACMFLDDRFGADNGIENRLWYFREDLQLNLHHMIWHLLFPLNSTLQAPRRGELFSFFHHDLLARYSAERLSNELGLTAPLDLQWAIDLEEGYNSHLVDGISGLTLPYRKAMSKLSNESLNSEMVAYFSNFTEKRHRVMSTVNRGTVKGKDYSEYLIKRYDYINLLGELSEASNFSFNPVYYGEPGYHDDGHWVIANIDVNLSETSPNDPAGIIADTGTAVRDPLFFRWHQYVDNVFQKYKATHLEPYKLHEGDFPLVFRGVKVAGVRVVTDGSSTTHSRINRINHLETFWNIRRFDLRGRLDFYENDTDTVGEGYDLADICAKHLDHQEFNYEIAIDNSFKVNTEATVRIYMAPRFKSQKLNSRFKMSEQRSLFFAMDLFKTVLKPGRNFVRRRSVDSSLTTPWPSSFKEMENMKTKLTDMERSKRAAYDCGYPHHLLLPKGNENGMVYDLFVMVTNGADDNVRDESPDYYSKYRKTPIHCGSPGRDYYPDNKPMGYPFDRLPHTKSMVITLPTGQQILENREVETLEEYIKEVPSMLASQIIIQHRNEISGLDNFIEIYAKNNEEKDKKLFDEFRKMTTQARSYAN